jgi:valyl-tRNA synthetase
MTSNNNPKNYGFVVANNEEEARAKIIAKFPELKDKKFTLRQDEDCLDTWFSSWLWPISVFDGINHPDNKDICYYYPTNDLVTGPDIIFFWVARMIMSGYEYRKEECFKNVYFTGIVRDKLGRKMSKQLGNSPDPIELMNKYGADGVRMGMLLSAPAGNDIHFDEALCEQGRNFCNKIWNSLRLVKGWNIAHHSDESQNPQCKDGIAGLIAGRSPQRNDVVIEWFENLLNKTNAEVDDLFSKYRLSEALMLIYKLFWDEFSAWYLEIIKPEFGKPIDKTTYDKTIEFFEELLKLLHPFMPFITEELYHALSDKDESIMFALPRRCVPCGDTGSHPQSNAAIIADFEATKEIISNIRNIRASKNISPKETLILQVLAEHNAKYDDVIKKLANVDIQRAPSNSPTGGEPTPIDGGSGAVSFMVGTCEYAVPVGNLINVEEEIAKMEAEIKYLEGFLKSVNAKLSNEKFVANAKPEIVENERKKQADSESKIRSLRESLAALQ